MFVDKLNINYFKFEKHEFSSIKLDAITAQGITLSNEVSKAPLEDGSILPDAIVEQPDEITFTAVVSDLAQNYSEYLSQVSDVAAAVFTDKKLRQSKSIRAWYDLKKLVKSKQLVYITSPIQLEPFSDMVIKEVRVDLDGFKALRFTATLVKFHILDKIKNRTYSKEVGKQSVRR